MRSHSCTVMLNPGRIFWLGLGPFYFFIMARAGARYEKLVRCFPFKFCVSLAAALDGGSAGRHLRRWLSRRWHFRSGGACMTHQPLALILRVGNRQQSAASALSSRIARCQQVRMPTLFSVTRLTAE